MFARASRLKLKPNARHQLHLSANDLYLPWLCPALYMEKRHRRSSSTIPSLQATSKSRPALTELKRPSPSARGESRGLASATAVDHIPMTDDYVPFENQSDGTPPKAFQLPWLATAKDVTLDHLNADTPIIIKDSLTTKPPRFRSFDAISGELQDILSTMKACLHVGRFERAAALMQRLNTLYKADSPALLAAHNDYIRESAWKIVSSRDQYLLNKLQQWFEVELLGRGVVPDATAYAFMIQAVLQDASGGKSNRSIRRYLHLAEEGGLRDELMNALLTVLNEQDFGRVTRVCLCCDAKKDVETD